MLQVSISTVSRIKRAICAIKEDTPFSIRMLLEHGTRKAVDRAVGRLAKAGQLERVARGLYIRPSGRPLQITDEELARTKAEAFGKQIFIHGRDAAISFGVENEEVSIKCSDSSHFAIDGPSSSFLSINGRIRFKAVCPRFLKFKDEVLGQVIRAMRYLGLDDCGPIALGVLRSKFERHELMKLYTKATWMTAWIADFLNPDIIKIGDDLKAI